MKKKLFLCYLCYLLFKISFGLVASTGTMPVSLLRLQEIHEALIRFLLEHVAEQDCGGVAEHGDGDGGDVRLAQSSFDAKLIQQRAGGGVEEALDRPGNFGGDIAEQ